MANETTAAAKPMYDAYTELTTEQVEQILNAATPFGARQADIAAIALVGNTVEAVAQYMWDHLMGEPEAPTEQDIIDAIVNNFLPKMDEARRIREELIKTEPVEIMFVVKVWGVTREQLEKDLEHIKGHVNAAAGDALDHTVEGNYTTHTDASLVEKVG